jgi:hypothetical protein
MPDWLPELVTLESCGGNWDQYLNLIYGYFKIDWLDSRPTYEGKRVGLRKHPVVKGKESTFWHLISEGPNEDDRIPDLRRCERIRWVRPIIENVGLHTDILVWKQNRRGNTNVAIALQDFSYIVFLGERTSLTGNYLIPLTAYSVASAHQRERYRKEWQEYKNAQVYPKKADAVPEGGI